MIEDLRPFGDPGSEQFRVDIYPFYLLNRAVSRYNTKIEALLRPIGLDIPSWRVLMILGEHEPQPIGQIAKAAVINLSTMMRIAERMQKAQLVVASESPADGRVTELALTLVGKEKLTQARAVAAPVYRRLIKGLSASDFRRFRDLLNRLYDNLE